MQETIEHAPEQTWTPAMAGEHVQLIPYFRGVHAPDFIAGLWGLMAADGALEHVFQATTPGDDLSTRMQYDITAFIRYFDPADGTRVVVMVVIKPTDNQPETIAGLIWFDEIIPQHRASINIWIREPYRGSIAKEAARLAVKAAFARWQLRTLWASTPWRSAYAIARSCGFQPEAVLHDFVHTAHGWRALHILRIARPDVMLEEI
jgi:RimJ/RimL family protein N-acetyltransferase